MVLNVYSNRITLFDYPLLFIKISFTNSCTVIMKSLKANDSLIRLKLIITDNIDKTVFNIINKADSILVLRANMFIVVISPENKTKYHR